MKDVSVKEQERWLPRKNPIMLVEIMAVVHALASVGHLLNRSQVLIFVDSESAEAALVKGGSSKEDICELTLVFWRLIQHFEILVYIDRVPTDSNISDGVSRGSRELPRRLGWWEVEIPDSLDWASGWIGPGEDSAG